MIYTIRAIDRMKNNSINNFGIRLGTTRSSESAPITFRRFRQFGSVERIELGLSMCSTHFQSISTFAHFVISLFMKLASSSGVLFIGAIPARAKSCFISGWLAARTISLCSLATTSRGVPAGESTAYQTPAS